MGYYQGFFQPKVKSFTLNDDGVERVIYYKEPRLDEELRRFDELKAKQRAAGKAEDGAEAALVDPEADSTETLLGNIRRVIVYQDGAPISDEDAQALIAMGVGAFPEFTAKLGEILGAPKKANGEAKNV